MYALTAEQVARITSLHRMLIARSLRERPEQTVVHEHLDLDDRHSFVLLRCDCTNNPSCTGFVLGVIDCDTGSRVNVMLKRDDLTKFVAAVWEQLGAGVRQ